MSAPTPRSRVLALPGLLLALGCGADGSERGEASSMTSIGVGTDDPSSDGSADDAATLGETADDSTGTPTCDPECEGVCLEGEWIRIQDGVEHHVKKGDFWQTPPNVPHGGRTLDSRCVVLDIFAPPREEYRQAGRGLGAATLAG